MSDSATPRIRERIWVTKMDHTTDPPTPIEEVFVEDGVVVERRDLRPQPEKKQEETDGGQ